MPQTIPPNVTRLRLNGLASDRSHDFAVAGNADFMNALAQELGLEKLRKLRLKGTLHPEGQSGWRLEAELGATIVQPCVITLAPVTT